MAWERVGGGKTLSDEEFVVERRILRVKHPYGLWRVPVPAWKHRWRIRQADGSWVEGARGFPLIQAQAVAARNASRNR